MWRWFGLLCVAGLVIAATLTASPQPAAPPAPGTPVAQLRLYTIDKGRLDDFANAWRAGVYPLRTKLGYRIHFAAKIPTTNQFVWLLTYDGPEAWEKKEAAYYGSAERKSLSPDPAQWIAQPQQLFVTPVVGLGASPTAGLQEAAPRQEPSVDLPAALARVLTDYEAAWRKRDPAALASLFAEDGFVLSGGRPPIRGRARVAQHYAGSGGSLSLRAIAYATEGSVGYIIGAYAEEKGQPDVGKFTLTLRRGADGRWLIVSDMDNPNRRAGD